MFYPGGHRQHHHHEWGGIDYQNFQQLRLPFSIGEGFYGVTSATNFTSATITFGVPQPRSFVIADFRLGSAATTPEPSTFALAVPLLLAGLASVRLRKRGVR